MKRRVVLRLIGPILALLPQTSHAQVDQIWQCQFQHCMDLVAGSSDTFSAAAAASTAPCKSGTSPPATCTVGQCFNDTDATGGQVVLWCTATNTWTTVTADPSLYLLLAGRASTANDPTISTGTEGTIYGGNSSGDDLRLRANSNTATVGTIFLDSDTEFAPNQQDATAGAMVKPFVYQPDFVLTGTGTTVAAIAVQPVIHLGSAGATGSSFSALASLGYILTDDATAAVSSSQVLLFNAAHTIATSVARNPMSQTTLNDIALTSNDGTGNQTQTSYTSLLDQSAFQTTSTGTLTRTNHYTVRSNPQITSNGAVATTITTRRGVYIEDVTLTGAGAAVTTNVGVDIAAQAAGTTDIGIRNADTTVYTPTTQAIATVNDQIDCTASAITLTVAAGGIVLASNPQVLDGQNGQICHIANVDSADAVTIADGNGLNLTAGDALGPQDTLTLMYSTTIGDWIEVARANN